MHKSKSNKKQSKDYNISDTTNTQNLRDNKPTNLKDALNACNFAFFPNICTVFQLKPLVQKPGYCKNTISKKTRLKFFLWFSYATNFCYMMDDTFSV